MSAATVVELIGPAGAGKTTLAHRIGADRHGRHRRLTLWGLPRWALIAAAASLLPSLLGAAARGHALRGPQLAQMIRLEALRRVVRREVGRGGVVLLDEGPVFALSWLDLSLRTNGSGALERWRRRIVHAWAPLLDAIVWLDASDQVIVHRIRTRAKAHPVKHAPDDEIFRFTADFRHAFHRVIADLTAARPVPIAQVRTDGQSLEAGVRRLLGLLEERRNGH